MVKLAEINRTSTFAWSHGCLPLIVAGTVAGAVDINFSSSSTLEIWDVFNPVDKTQPVVSANVDTRFHAIAWSKPFDKYFQGVIAGGFENGTIEFWDADVFMKTKDLAKASIHKSNAHTGPVRSLSFHCSQNHVLVSGGSQGQIFIWDLKTFAEPKGPGSAMTPMDEISSVSWNKQVPHIFANTGNSGYTSIWDLKAKREVLHLSYQGNLGRANFSSVAWHPTLSTKLVTASDNDGCPVILTWDLRNANAPEMIMQGHTKGVLSLDWCAHDPELLISSGKDNATILWNPITGQKLGEYPTTANWAFKSEFAPAVPDIFATASFDGKILVQSLQDTSPPVSDKAQKSTSDNDFWNQISTTDTQQPVFEVKQAPAWLKRPSSVSFGFGSKLVMVKKLEGNKSVVTISKANVSKAGNTEKLSEAIKSNSFKEFIDGKISQKHINQTVQSDWELLQKLSNADRKKLLSFDDNEDETKDETIDGEKEEAKKDDKISSNDADDSFFDNLGSSSILNTKLDPYVPSGEFKLIDSSANAEEANLINLILGGKIDKAITASIEGGKLVEALILALNGSEESKETVKNEYFKKNKDNSLARILYSVSSKNVTDIVSHGDLDNWKQIAASIASFSADDDEYNSKITELGDRLLESENHSREDALLCYLAGNAIQKISSIWLKELPSIQEDFTKSKDMNITSPAEAKFEALSEFVEKLITYRSITNSKGVLSGPSIEPTCKAVLEYASTLASNGDFELADTFLELLPEDLVGLKLEKERIAQASGKITTPAIKSTVSTQRSGTGSRIPQGRAPVSNYAKSPASTHMKPVTKPFVPTNTAPTSVNGTFGGITSSPLPQGNSFKPAANPYAPAAQTSSQTFHNPYMPTAPSVPSVPNMASSPVNGAVPSPPPAKGSSTKKAEGWNDLPETFKPKIVSRKPSTMYPPVTTTPPPAPPIKRNPSGIAPQVGPPPKGLTRTPSKQSTPGSDIPQGNTTPNVVPPKKYAPPPPMNGASAVNSPKAASASLNNVPKNPYAPPPSMAAAPRNTYAPPTPPIVSTPKMATTPVQAPPKNPYAPTTSNSSPSMGFVPPKVGFAPPPQQGGFASPPPPPQQEGFVPPPPTSSTVVPPPRSSASAPPPAAVSEPPKSKPKSYPPGDRSHIPEKSLPIYTTLSSTLDSIMPNLPAQYQKHGDAVVKRLNILFDHLNNQDLLSDETIEGLNDVCARLAAKDYNGALALHVDLATKHSEETSNWHPGLKHLIQMAEALQ